MLDIWLRTSIKAHHFIAPQFWRDQLEDMREVYLPGAMNRVFEADGEFVGFCSVHGDSVASLFVLPKCQGAGIGTQLLTDAKTSKSILELSVYSANARGIRSYENQGFETLNEQMDEHTGHLERLMRWFI